MPGLPWADPHLRLCVHPQIYYKPLRESSLSPDPIISKDELATLFSNLEIILSLNEVMCDEIRGRLAAWSVQQKIGDVLLRYVRT